MLALALQPLLDNMRHLGMGRALRILQVVARMARESTEGQAIELHWIRERQWQLAEADYVRMVYKKTSWYTFVSPVLVGAIVAGASAAEVRPLRNFAAVLGIEFQAQDDVLNLVGEGSRYGKEIAGDLWEGKHTLIVMHMMRSATARERERARRILSKPRPAPRADVRDLAALLDSLRASNALSASGKRKIETALRHTHGAMAKTEAEIEELLALIRRYRSVEYARDVALRYARRAADLLARATWVPPSPHRSFLGGLVSYVIDRDW
jgi:geranylgeranyl diphosphate synthase type II